MNENGTNERDLQPVVDYLHREQTRLQSATCLLRCRLQRIAEEAAAELARIEQDGGVSGFALRIRELAGEGEAAK